MGSTGGWGIRQEVHVGENAGMLFTCDPIQILQIAVSVTPDRTKFHFHHFLRVGRKLAALNAEEGNQITGGL